MTRVSEIGEFALIQRLAQVLGVEYPAKRGSNLLVGLGDDAAVAERAEGALVWTTDTLVAGLHFLPEKTAWADAGWKALAVNLSDIAAMGAAPHLALVTLLLPGDFGVDNVIDFYRGVKEAADAFDVTVAGGDVVRAPIFAATLAVSGWADSERLGRPRAMTRDAARAGDVVAVSGNLGDSAGGLQLLKNGASIKTKAQRSLRAAHERPQPRVALGRAAVRAGVRCAIDVSDGLMQDLRHIAAASGVSIRIDAARVPVSAALHDAFPAEALGLALTGGEDYELALIGARPVIDALIDSSDTPLTAIGEVVHSDEPHVSVIDETGREVPLREGGWDHFSDR